MHVVKPIAGSVSLQMCLYWCCEPNCVAPAIPMTVSTTPTPVCDKQFFLMSRFLMLTNTIRADKYLQPLHTVRILSICVHRMPNMHVKVL